MKPRLALNEAFPEQMPEAATPELKIIEGGLESDDVADTGCPELYVVREDDPLVEDVTEESDSSEFGRAAAGAGVMIGNYVEDPRQPEKERRSKVVALKPKNESTKDPDDDFKGGGGGQWWREQVRKAKETHEDTCICMLCTSPDL